MQPLPRLCFVLTLLGVLPFLIATWHIAQGTASWPWLVSIGLQANWLTLLHSYGAVILSFLGGIHWGIAMQIAAYDASQAIRLVVWSNVVSLTAWFSLILLVTWLALAVLAVCFLLQWLIDWRLAKRYDIAADFIRLRSLASPWVIAMLGYVAYVHYSGVAL